MSWSSSCEFDRFAMPISFVDIGQIAKCLLAAYYCYVSRYAVYGLFYCCGKKEAYGKILQEDSGGVSSVIYYLNRFCSAKVGLFGLDKYLWPAQPVAKKCQLSRAFLESAGCFSWVTSIKTFSRIQNTLYRGSLRLAHSIPHSSPYSPYFPR